MFFNLGPIKNRSSILRKTPAPNKKWPCIYKSFTNRTQKSHRKSYTKFYNHIRIIHISITKSFRNIHKNCYKSFKIIHKPNTKSYKITIYKSYTKSYTIIPKSFTRSYKAIQKCTNHFKTYTNLNKILQLTLHKNHLENNQNIHKSCTKSCEKPTTKANKDS